MPPKASKVASYTSKNSGSRGKSGYISFVKHQRPISKKENPEATFGELSRLVGAKWRGLSDAEKEVRFFGQT